jgi:hypothetical protein
MQWFQFNGLTINESVLVSAAQRGDVLLFSCIRADLQGKLDDDKKRDLFTDAFKGAAKFGRVDIAYSIDNVGDRFEYERHGALWEQANQNIDVTHASRNWCKNITTQLCFTINIQNVYYLDELLVWADTKPFDSVYFNMLHSPDHMSIQRMTPAATQLVLNKLKTTFWISEKYQQEIDNIIKFIENGSGGSGTEFVEKMQRADEYRGQNFIDTHPEIARAMGYDL